MVVSDSDAKHFRYFVNEEEVWKNRGGGYREVKKTE